MLLEELVLLEEPDPEPLELELVSLLLPELSLPLPELLSLPEDDDPLSEPVSVELEELSWPEVELEDEDEPEVWWVAEQLLRFLVVLGATAGATAASLSGTTCRRWRALMAFA